MRKTGAVIICLCCALYMQAQTDDFQSAYKAFQRQAQAEYDSFRDNANRQYADFVEKAWREYKMLPATPKPKDKDLPPVVIKEEDLKKPIKGKPIPIQETIVPPIISPQPVPVAPIREQPKPVEKWVTFGVYGTEMRIRFNDEQHFTLPDCSERSVADAWRQLSGKAYDNTIRDCLALRSKLNLSDWAYLNMLYKMAETCVGKGDERVLIAAYIFCQSGYQMRLARANGKLRLLYGTQHQIYGKGSFRIDGVSYYMFDGEESNANICSIGFPQETPLSLYVPKAQGLAVTATSQRTLASKRYPQMKAQVSVNKNLIDFYSSYPTSMVGGNFMTRWAMYANTPMEQTVMDGLYPVLRRHISGCSEQEAVERLLNWVQTAFVYEYDDKVWGHDRAFFAEESLYYPYCDCEDRSILLSRLVRDLLALKVVLVYYPGHLATAIHFSNDVRGDYLMLSGTRYTICDPTYIGASVGMTMPDMDNSKATVILLE